MRVLHLVSAPTMTGPADPALGLVRAQRELGIEAVIAFDQVRSGSMREKVEAANVPIEPTLKLCTTRAFSTALADGRRLSELSGAYDVVHAHMSHDHALAAAAKGRAKLVRSIHHPRSVERRGLQGWMYRRTDGLVLVADEHRRRLLQAYPGLSARIAVVPGAVDADRFAPGETTLRDALGIDRDAFVFGMIARIKPGRGHEIALTALAEVEDAYLLLVGKGEGERIVRRNIAELGLEGRVIFSGFRDADLPEAIRTCDVTILLAEGNDASCRAVLESMSCGVPVIGADRPAIREALEGVGLLIDPAAGPLAAAMRSAMSARPDAGVVRSRILERYTDRTRAESVQRLYEALG